MYSSREESREITQILHFHLLPELGLWYPWKGGGVDHHVWIPYQILYPKHDYLHQCQIPWLSGFPGFPTSQL